jgi:hypothetical protein
MVPIRESLMSSENPMPLFGIRLYHGNAFESHAVRITE